MAAVTDERMIARHMASALVALGVPSTIVEKGDLHSGQRLVVLDHCRMHSQQNEWLHGSCAWRVVE